MNYNADDLPVMPEGVCRVSVCNFYTTNRDGEAMFTKNNDRSVRVFVEDADGVRASDLLILTKEMEWKVVRWLKAFGHEQGTIEGVNLSDLADDDVMRDLFDGQVCYVNVQHDGIYKDRVNVNISPMGEMQVSDTIQRREKERWAAGEAGDAAEPVFASKNKAFKSEDIPF